MDAARSEATLPDGARPAVLHIASHFAFEPDGTEAESFLLLGGGATLSLADFAASGEFPVDQLDLLTLPPHHPVALSERPGARRTQ